MGGPTLSKGGLGRLVEAARSLRSEVAAIPCPWLPALSIFDDEHYENYDYDIVGPADRRRIARALASAGFRQTSGRILQSPQLVLEFPKPTRLLAGDPAIELERVLERRESVPFATPTQVLLSTLRRLRDDALDVLESDLVAFVREQPANLDKVRDWLRDTPAAGRFARVLPALRAAQDEGFDLRRRGVFRSELVP